MRDEDKLRRIAEIINEGEPASPAFRLYAYDLPPLPADQVVADGKTINKDGSIWITSKGESGPVGTRVRTMYGYLSPLKNPELWAALRTVMGDEAFERWSASRDPWAIYRADLHAIVFSGEANALNVSFLLSTGARFAQEG